MSDEKPPSKRDNITQLAARMREKLEQQPPVQREQRPPPARQWYKPREAPTEPIKEEKIRAITLSDMRKLTPKQEIFCERIVAGELQYEAARIAGYAGANNVVLGIIAQKLLGMLKIKLRIEELTAGNALNAQMTRDQHMVTLADLRDQARMVGNYNAAIKAEELRGKLSGHYREDEEVKSQNITDRVAKLPVEEQLRLVQAALQRIEAISGSRITMTLGPGQPAPQTAFKTITTIEPVPLAEMPNHDFDGIDDEPVGIDPRRTNSDEDLAERIER